MRYFLLLLAQLFLFLRNPFSNKKYQARLINRVVLICRSNPEIVIQDYYAYIKNLLLTHSGKVQSRFFIFFDCPGLRPLKLLTPCINICLQIEHTLLKPGISESDEGVPGHLFIQGSHQKYKIRIAEFERLKKADIVFDYSRINLFNIQSSRLLQSYLKNLFVLAHAYILFQLALMGAKVLSLYLAIPMPLGEKSSWRV